MDGEMNVHLSEVVAVVVGQERSAALECCSEQRTPEGGTTPTSLWLHLCVSAEPFEWTEAQIHGTAGQIPQG